MSTNRMIIIASAVIVVSLLIWQVVRTMQSGKKTDTSFTPSSNSTLTSPDIDANGMIPKEFTCNGEGKRLTLAIDSLPPAARYLAVVMQDLDAPAGIYDHWVIWNIPAMNVIGPDFSGGVTGKNTAGKNSYISPCPPSGEHRYRFRVYGYNQPLELSASSSATDLVRVVAPRAVTQLELIGRYKK